MNVFNDYDYWSMIEPFSIDIIASPGTNNEFVFQGIFDNGHKAYGDDLILSILNPVITCRTSDVIALAQYAVIRANNINYKIVDIQPNGYGITMLELKK